MPPVDNSITISSLQSAPLPTPWKEARPLLAPTGVTSEPSPRVDIDPARTAPVVEDGWGAQAVTIQEAATLALLDAADLLSLRALVYQAKPWPHRDSPAALRTLLSATIRYLVNASLPCQDAVLRLSSGLSPGAELLIVHLDLAGGRVEGPGPLDSHFDETLDIVQQAGGYLNVEWSESATHIRLVIPLRTR